MTESSVDSDTSEDYGRRWVLAAEAENRPGALNAISAVFASRGVNFDTSIASVDAAEGIGHIVGVFRSGERRARLLQRTVDRLDTVRSSQVRSVTDPSVRATAVIRRIEGGPNDWRPPAGIAATWTGEGTFERPLLVEASLVTVERLLEAARAAGLRAALGSVSLP